MDLAGLPQVLLAPRRVPAVAPGLLRGAELERWLRTELQTSAPAVGAARVLLVSPAGEAPPLAWLGPRGGVWALEARTFRWIFTKNSHFRWILPKTRIFRWIFPQPYKCGS